MSAPVVSLRRLSTRAVLGAGEAACRFPLIVRDKHALASAVERPWPLFFNVRGFPGVFAKAGALLHGLVRAHPLVDGNKRTAWAAAWVFLGANGILLPEGFDVDDAERLVLAAATGEIDALQTGAGLRAIWDGERPAEPEPAGLGDAIDFSDPHWGQWSGAGPGWRRILRELDRDLLEIAPRMRWSQVKQKLGRLRARPEPDSVPEEAWEAARALIDQAELRADATCEQCGAPGTLNRERGFVQTICRDCADARPQDPPLHEGEDVEEA